MSFNLPQTISAYASDMNRLVAAFAAVALILSLAVIGTTEPTLADDGPDFLVLNPENE